MAITTYGVNDALTVKLWAKKLAVEALKATEIAPLIGTSSNSCIHLKEETKKGKGDQVTFGLRMQLTGDGRTEGETLEGNEESLTTYNDQVLINELAHAVRMRDGNAVIDSQRVLFNVRTEAKDGLVDWMAKRMSVSMFNQVCGYTPQTNTKYSGLNAITAPSASRRVFAAGTTDEGLVPANLLKLVHLDFAKEKAITADPPIRPLMIAGQPKFVVYLHPFQVTDLRTDAATAGNWFDIQKAAIQGGQTTKNPIYDGSLGEHNGIILRMSHDIPQGVNSSTGVPVTTVRRAVLLGAQSAAMAYGMNFGEGDEQYSWIEELFDYRRELGVSMQTVFGMKKIRFNALDFGTIVISTYAVAH